MTFTALALLWLLMPGTGLLTVAVAGVTVRRIQRGRKRRQAAQ